jgi:hypothetical protein
MAHVRRTHARLAVRLQHSIAALHKCSAIIGRLQIHMRKRDRKSDMPGAARRYAPRHPCIAAFDPRDGYES